MQRQRGELVSVAEAFSDLSGPVAAIRDASPQALHHFTQADQVNQLVSASEADPDLGFMGRTMALCSLPRTNPGNRLQYKRVNGPFKLIMTATGDHKLPFGNLPRLILAWVSTAGSVPAVPRKPLPLHQLVYFCSAEVVQIYSALDTNQKTAPAGRLPWTSLSS